ncbi:MAG TPA: hypothetical protein VNC16_04335 [Solirubrobacterales bacterium]|nr:hypothetical protein [Solirubrobacterales bacterium]
MDVLTIRFPRDVRPDVMEPLLLRLHGLMAPPSFFRAPDRIAVECVGDERGVRVQVWASSEPLRRLVRASLESSLVGGSIEERRPALPSVDQFVRLSLGAKRAPLRLEGAGLAGIVAPLARLGGGQVGIVQFVLSPAPLRMQAKLLAASKGRRSASVVDAFATAYVDRDRAAALRAKAAAPLFRVSVAVAASSATITAALVASFRQFAGPRAFVTQHRVFLAGRARAELIGREHRWFAPALVGGEELAAMLGPDAEALRAVGGPVLPSRRLTPPKTVAADGRVLAVSNAGPERRIALRTVDARTHLACIGPTGVGKTTLLVQQALATANEGCGVVLIEPLKGGATESFLSRLPDREAARVVILDPERERDYPPAINFLDRVAGSDAASVASGILGVLRELHPDLGQRSADVAYNAIYLAASIPGATLADVPRLLLDRAARNQWLDHVRDPFVRGFFDEFNRRTVPDQLNIAAPVVGRLRPLLRPDLAPIIAQPESTIDFDRILSERRLLLVRVPAGAELFGALIVDRIWRAVLRRTTMAETDRPDTLLAIDEVQAFLRTGVDASQMLATARELRLGMLLASQSIQLCPPALRQALLVNARSRVVWATDESEASILGRGLGPELEPIDLVGLGAFEVAIRLAIGPSTARPFTGRTLPLPPTVRDSTAAIREQSRQRYGRPRAAVEDDLRDRLAPVQSAIDPEAIGTRPQ